MRRLANRWGLVGAALIVAVLAVTLLIRSFELARDHAQARALQHQAALVLGESVHDVLSREVALARVIGALRSPIGNRWPILADIVTGQPVASSAGFIEPVTQRQRAAFERQTGLRLIESPTAGVVRPAPPRPLHLVLTESWQKGVTTKSLGLDLAANPLRTRLMLEAASSGRQIASPPVPFIGLTKRRYGVIAYVASRDRHGRLLGWVVSSYRSSALAATVAAHLPGTQLTIRDGGTVLFSDGASTTGAPDILSVGGRSWQLWVNAPGTADFAIVWLVLGLGLGIAAAVTLVLRQSATRERYATRMLAEREADEAALNRIATLVAEQGTPAEVFTAVAEQVGKLLDSRTAAVSRFEPDAGRGVVCGGWTPEGLDLAGSTFALDGGTASAEVFRTGHSARTPGSYENPGDPIMHLMSDLGGTGGIAAPIIVAGERWGALGAAYSSDSIPAGAEERLERFARLVGLAISNAEAWDRLERQASTDGLTGLANRRTFDARLQSELARAHRYGRDLSLVLLDIDHFKQINDRHGHGAGDRVLTRVAQLLSGTARRGELVARVGGEEFAWLLPETDAVGALGAAEKARELLAREDLPGVGRVTVSAGVRTAEPGDTPVALLRDADQALYWAKEGGRNMTVVYAREARETLEPATQRD